MHWDGLELIQSWGLSEEESALEWKGVWKSAGTRKHTISVRFGGGNVTQCEQWKRQKPLEFEDAGKPAKRHTTG